MLNTHLKTNKTTTTKTHTRKLSLREVNAPKQGHRPQVCATPQSLYFPLSLTVSPVNLASYLTPFFENKVADFIIRVLAIALIVTLWSAYFAQAFSQHSFITPILLMRKLRLSEIKSFCQVLTVS